MPSEVLIFAAGAEIKKGPDLLGTPKAPAAAVISVETVRTNLSAFVSSLDQIIPTMQARDDGFKLTSFDVAVGVNAKGEVGFLGTGVEAGTTATLTLKFSHGG